MIRSRVTPPLSHYFSTPFTIILLLAFLSGQVILNPRIRPFRAVDSLGRFPRMGWLGFMQLPPTEVDNWLFGFREKSYFRTNTSGAVVTNTRLSLMLSSMRLNPIALSPLLIRQLAFSRTLVASSPLSGRRLLYRGFILHARANLLLMVWYFPRESSSCNNVAPLTFCSLLLQRLGTLPGFPSEALFGSSVRPTERDRPLSSHS